MRRLSRERTDPLGRARVPRLLLAVLVAVVVGAASAGVWVWLADPAAYVVNERGATLTGIAAGEQVQVLIVYVTIAAVVGLVAGVVAGWRARTWLVTPLLVVLTLLAGIVAWRLGTWWGPSTPDLAAAEQASVGDRLPLPLGLGSFAPVLVWPIAALVGLLLTASSRNDPDHRSGPAVRR